MDLLKFKKFYMNPKTGQAIGLICRDETASWGKVTIVEVATPGQLGFLVPQATEMQVQPGWVEITRKAFMELQNKYCIDVEAAKVKKGGKASWLGRLLRKKK